MEFFNFFLDFNLMLIDFFGFLYFNWFFDFFLEFLYFNWLFLDFFLDFFYFFDFLGVKKIVSNAIDPVSAYLLCRYFDGSIVDPEYLSFKASPSYKELTLGSYRDFTSHIELYTEYLETTGDSLWSIFVECPVNEETQQKNDDLFIRYVEATKCITDP